MTTFQEHLDDAAVCAALARHHARTFALASRFLPAEKRRAAFAVYGFCRVADDIVDGPSASRDCDRGEALEKQRNALIAALNGRPDGPLFRELAWAVRRFGIPSTPFHALINALRSDLAPSEIATYSDLTRYCEGVASTVGEMCAYVFGMPCDSASRALALRHARTLGVALQLTNILRDVGEDAALGRCYLPSSDLAAFGIERHEILERTIRPGDGRWQRLMHHQIGRARALYAQAEPGLHLLDADARCCATICSRGYAAILEAIEVRAFDSLNGRARVGSTRKTWILVESWYRTRRSGHEAALHLPPAASDSMQGVG